MMADNFSTYGRLNSVGDSKTGRRGGMSVTKND
jgi:hypothetical protein